MIILDTTRLLLREFVPEDVDALAEVISDPETMKYYPAPYDRQGVIDWIKRNRRRYGVDGFGLWGMVLKSNQQLVGDCGLIKHTIEAVDEIEIGYHLHRKLWGQGLASEAARACRDYGFAHVPVARLISLIRPENSPSRRVAEKNGMHISKEIMWRGLPHYLYAIERPGLQLQRTQR
jgi:RimJ/RimL family protein N-acetyltransferase